MPWPILCPHCSAADVTSEMVVRGNRYECTRCSTYWLVSRVPPQCTDCAQEDGLYLNSGRVLCVECLWKRSPAKEEKRNA